ncbi:MAG: response regulator, partial [Planctomycetota bacterium]
MNDHSTKPSVLFVDDDPVDQLLYQRLGNRCEAIGTINTESYADRALARILDTPELIEDLIFLDMNLPRMSGIEFLESVDKLSEDIKARLNIVVATTSIRE